MIHHWDREDRAYTACWRVPFSWEAPECTADCSLVTCPECIKNLEKGGETDMDNKTGDSPVKLEAIFKVDRDTKNTRRYAEDATDRPPIMNTAYVQLWALRKLTGGDLPKRIRITLEVA